MATKLSADKAKVWLFYLQYAQKGRLSLNVVREIGSYLADFSLELAQVTKAFLRFFNGYTSTWGPQVWLRTQIQADEYSSWIVLKNSSLFCSEGGDCQAGYSGSVGSLEKKEAYLLSRAGEVNFLPHMLTARHSHGVIQVLHLYVFGGGKT